LPQKEDGLGPRCLLKAQLPMNTSSQIYSKFHHPSQTGNIKYGWVACIPGIQRRTGLPRTWRGPSVSTECDLVMFQVPGPAWALTCACRSILFSFSCSLRLAKRSEIAKSQSVLVERCVER
jgi:hypothetical protein